MGVRATVDYSQLLLLATTTTSILGWMHGSKDDKVQGKKARQLLTLLACGETSKAWGGDMEWKKKKHGQIYPNMIFDYTADGIFPPIPS